MERERQWLHDRGLTDKTIEEAGLVFNSGKIKIPYRINGKEVGYQVRNIDVKEFRFNDGFTPTIYLPTGFYPTGYDVWVTEGAMDSLVLHQLGYPSVAIPSASTFGVVDSLPFRNLILALDNDDAGELACKKIAALGLPFKLYRVKYDGKDPNETVLANGGKFPHSIVPYLVGGIKHIKDVHLNGNITNAAVITFDNGMPAWNNGDLVVLYGKEKSGKSSTILRVLSKNRIPTLLESYEMPPERIKDWFQRLGGTDDYPLYITTEFGEISWHDILARINSSVSQLGVKLVVVDHVLFLTGNNDNVTQKLSEVTRRLKLLAMHHKIVIVIIAHETDGRIYGSRMIGANADHILHLRRLSNSIIIDGIHRYAPQGSYQLPTAL